MNSLFRYNCNTSQLLNAKEIKNNEQNNNKYKRIFNFYLKLKINIYIFLKRCLLKVPQKREKLITQLTIYSLLNCDLPISLIIELKNFSIIKLFYNIILKFV